jgi:putative methionine-R-sulfoxide reductase with GAF domain
MPRGATPPDFRPENSIFGRDRRRADRHRAHTPAYASLSGSARGAGLDLCEVLNISENGMCIQASSQLKTNCLLPLSLDLSATGARVQVVGHVVWSEASGKTGIRFPEMAQGCRIQLQEWLQANRNAEALHAATEENGHSDPSAIQAKPGSASAYTSLITEWAEIQKEVELYGPELDRALHTIAQRALTMTWASGTAIALINRLNPSEMVCRARAGTDSPELGARLESGAGFSGECVRLGKSIVCDDTERDSRVDRQSCRVLGIRSILACPVTRDNEVIGIIEAFSPEPAAFWENDITILRRLAELVANTVRRAEHAHADVLAFPENGYFDSDYEIPVPQDSSPHYPNVRPVPFRRRAILLLAAVVCVTAVVWVAAPWIQELGSSTSPFPSLPAAQADSSPDTYVSLKFPDVKKLALSGEIGAEYALGMRYANGDGVKEDYHEARQWFLKAAEAGHVRGQAKVAACYWAGKGGAQDYSKAYFWALLAQAGGDETSRAIVMSSAAHLSSSQTAAEQKQAELWLHSHHIGHASDSE